MRPSLSHVLTEINTQIDISKNLISSVRSLRISQIQLERITELSFLRIFIAWESFLEESFIRYLVGAKSPSGFRPRKYVDPKNLDHATKLIYSGRQYFRWNSPSEITAISEIYFKDGEPYKNVIQGAITSLNEMSIIRNRIAHKSIDSKNKFNSFIRRKFGHGIRGMTPGRFLLKINPLTPGVTFLDFYVEQIKIASRIIVR